MTENFFSSEYLIGGTIPGFAPSDKFFLLISAILVVVGIALWIFTKATKSKLQKDLFSRWQVLSLTIGLAGLIWAGMRYELIRFLSMHIIVILIYVAGLYWAFTIVRYWLGEYRGLKKQLELEQQKSKYL